MTDREAANSARPHPVNVLLAYPKDLTGRLIAEALSHNQVFNVAAHVASAEAAIAFANHTEIDIALIALDMNSEREGLELLRRLRGQNTSIRAVMLMDNPDPQTVVESFRLGAKGVFCMSMNGYELLCKCIQCTHAGQIWATAQELHWVMDWLTDSKNSSVAPLPIQNFRRGSYLKPE